MKRKLWSVVGILALLLALAPNMVSAAPPPPRYDLIDIGPELRAQEPSEAVVEQPGAEELAGELAAGEALANASSTDCITATKYFLILNDYTGQYQVTTFNLMGEGPLSQVWVQTNLAWPAGDPRPTPVITCEQVAYLLGEFENNMYPKETSFFGMPDSHNGSYALLPSLLGLPGDYYYDEAGRQIVLVSNVRDDQYYNPSYPNYIAGFYSPTYEIYFDRNVMTIDSYDWANRIGPAATRPYLYEGVFAHEYQHLLHDDYDSDEESWINEGMSDLAEELVGYFPALQGHINAAAANPENSLTVWEDQGGLEILTDYGQAYLFQHYLMEKFGQPFIQALFHNPDNSITGVNSTLDMTNPGKNFADIFNDWSIAMLIDSAVPGGGRYAFNDFQFKLNVGTPASPNPEAYDTDGSPPWGTDYIWIDGNPKELAKLTFNGVEYSVFPTEWSVDDGMLWSGTGDLLDNWAIFGATGGGILTFDTIYDLEDYWDFGFVQVSTDGGYTWTSLANAYTTYEYDPNAHPKVIENLPGLTSYITDPVTMSYDLSAYAGQDILIGFRMVTDWGTHYGGWWIDNVFVNDVLISDGTSTAPFKSLTEIIPIENDFRITFVGFSDKKSDKANPIKVVSMKLSDMTENGLYELDSLLKTSSKAMMLVTLEVPEDLTNYVGYTYDFTYANGGPKK